MSKESLKIILCNIIYYMSFFILLEIFPLKSKREFLRLKNNAISFYQKIPYKIIILVIIYIFIFYICLLILAPFILLKKKSFIKFTYNSLSNLNIYRVQAGLDILKNFSIVIQLSEK
jgi:hypothetical protein